MPKSLIFLLLFSLLTQGCATATRSTLLGMSIGASLGGAIGNSQSDNRDRSTMKGAAIGAIAGGLLGYLSNKNKVDAVPVKASLGGKEFEMPPITRPRVNCSQVPDAIEGNKWIEKHRVCIIDSPSTWSR